METLFKGTIYLCLIAGVYHVGSWWWDAENYGMRASVIDHNESELEAFLLEDTRASGWDILVDKATNTGKLWHLNGKIELSSAANPYNAPKYYTFESVVAFCGHKDTYYASHMEVFEMLEFTIKDPEGNIWGTK